jgi:3'(2'), 5'-bisphosphate nucleotidase
MNSPTPSPLHSPAFADALLELCARAGAEIEREYHGARADEYREKSDDSPITRADIASHHCLLDGLARLAPGVPVLSEESSCAEIAGRHEWQRLWLVDPLDGTKEFLNRTGEFTINLALIDAGRPTLGLLYLPLARCAYLGIPGQGGWRCDPGTSGWQRTALVPRRFTESGGLTVLASRRHRNEQLSGLLRTLEARTGSLERHNSGSALKFARLAEGGGDCYPRFSPCSEWDVAAGQALLESVGGAVLGMDGAPLQYNARQTLLSPHFLAVADASAPLWPELLAGLR